MAPPSKLAIATSSVRRLIKEEQSYHKELEQHAARIQKLEADKDDENAPYMVKQERQAMEETKTVLPTVRARISKALTNLEEQLELNRRDGGEEETEEVTKAKEALADGLKAVRESA